MIGNWRDGRERLFMDERDYLRFLERLEERGADFGIRPYTFCLMSNHYHLVLETPEANLSGFQQSLATAYTVQLKYLAAQVSKDQALRGKLEQMEGKLESIRKEIK
jgi:REP element-mobilizing transposase RayT